MADEYSDEDFADENEAEYEAEFEDQHEQETAPAVVPFTPADNDPPSSDAVDTSTTVVHDEELPRQQSPSTPQQQEHDASDDEDYDAAEFDSPDIEENTPPDPVVATDPPQSESTATPVPSTSDRASSMQAIPVSIFEYAAPTRARSSSVPKIELDVDPELQTTLVRRKSIPRPAPVARLPSLGELVPAAADELEVPTNEITEEAAALVVGDGTASDSKMLVRRPSAQPFFPRLPSLRETPQEYIAGELARDEVSTEDLGDKAELAAKDNDGDGDDDYSDDEEEQEAADDEGPRDEKSDVEDPPRDQVAHTSEPGSVEGDATPMTADTPVPSATSDPATAPTEPEADQEDEAYAAEFGDDEPLNDQPPVEIGQSEPVAEAHITTQGETPAVTTDLMVSVMAEVASGSASNDEEDAIPEHDGDDDVDWTALEVEEHNHRETERLLQEAQQLVDQHEQRGEVAEETTASEVTSPPAETEAPQYADEAFSDDDYAADDIGPGDDLGDDGALLYESDHEELGADDAKDSNHTTAVFTNQEPTQPSETTKPTVTETPPAVTVSSTNVQPASQPVSIKQAKSSSTPSIAVTTRPIRPVQPTSTRSLQRPTPAKTKVDNASAPPAKKPEVPRFTPVLTSRSKPQASKSSNSPPRVESASSSSPGRTTASPPKPSSTSPHKFYSPPASPPQPSPIPRKAPVYKQPKPAKPPNPEAAKAKKLKPVKCPPNLRIDLPSHVDKQKRDWLLLNMFHHGDDVSKYEPFIPTESVASSTKEKPRPLSARQIYGESLTLPTRDSTSRGSYSRHSARKIVAGYRPVDPALQAREKCWVTTKPSDAVIPQYDSILDKYCKTVTSPVVQRRIYETRMDDLSPQLAMVLEKRAFKEWKSDALHDGFGAVSSSYKTEIVPQSSSSTTKLHHPQRPPASPSTAQLPDP